MKQLRFPGVASFEDNKISGSLFFGREAESTRLLHYILSETLTILFSKSGYGKTSILKASLFAKLREKGYYPFLIRFNIKNYTPHEAILNSLEDIGSDQHVELIIENKAGHLKSVLADLEIWSDDDKLLAPVLVLDQFEEMFTLEHNAGHREALFNELAELMGAMRDNGLKAKIVISIREDFLANLEKLSIKIPSIFTNRFRLEPLMKANAEEVIVKPASIELEGVDMASPSFYFSANAKKTILDFLSTKIVDGQVVMGDEIEPIQLQIICSELEERVMMHKIQSENGRLVIHTRDMGGQAGMQQILSSFYDKQLLKLHELGLKEPAIHAIRVVIEEELIVNKRRVPVDYGALISNVRINTAAIDMLIYNKLLKKESHQGNFLVEISHDTLVEPILGLYQKRKIQENQAAAERKAKSKAVKAVMYSLIAFLILGALAFIYLDKQEQLKDKKLTDQEKYFYSSVAARKTNLTLAYQIARKGLQIDTSNTFLKQFVSEIEQNEQVFIINKFNVQEKVISGFLDEPNNKVIINGEKNTYVWDTLNVLLNRYPSNPLANIGDEYINKKYFMVLADAGRAGNSSKANIEIRDEQNNVYSTFTVPELGTHPAVSIYGTRFMIGHYLYEKDKKPVHLFDDNAVSGISASIISGNPKQDKDSTYIIYASRDGVIRIQNLKDKSVERLNDSNPDNTVKALATTSDCRFVFSGGTSKDLQVWDRNRVKAARPGGLLRNNPLTMKGHTDYINDIAVSSDNTHILTGSDDGTAILWRFDEATTTCKLVSVLRGHNAALSFVNFTADGDEMITGDVDGDVIIWRLGKANDIYNSKNRAVFSPLEYRNLGLHDDNLIYTYDTSNLKNLISSTIQYSASIPNVNIYPDDKTYLKSLELSCKEVLNHYNRIFNHLYFRDSVNTLNHEFLCQGYADLVRRQNVLLFRQPVKYDTVPGCR